MTKTEPRSAGSGGGREKATPTELLALAERIENWDCIRFQDIEGWAKELRTLSTPPTAAVRVDTVLAYLRAKGYDCADMRTFRADLTAALDPQVKR